MAPWQDGAPQKNDEVSKHAAIETDDGARRDRSRPGVLGERGRQPAAAGAAGRQLSGRAAREGRRRGQGRAARAAEPAEGADDPRRPCDQRRAHGVLDQEGLQQRQEAGFILFNEFPLTGYSSGTREEKLKFTIQVPGSETERIGELAKACDTYVIFGSYATDPEWPGHILSLSPVTGRNGKVKHVYWKSRNVIRLNDDEIPTTTVENVRDRFRAKYGIEEEFPVLMTEYGNIAVSTAQLDPFVFAAYAMRGVEIMLRTATLFSKVDVQAIALYNNVHSAMSNITFPADSGVPASLGGGSLIVDPRGKVLAEDPSNDKSIVEAEISIAAFRKGRTIPRYLLEVVAPVFDQYVQEVPLNHLDLPAAKLPQTTRDMKDLLDRNSRWKKK
ncbi:MAG: hypothetical protein IT481_00200 [Gammaproteobacteria bacterium]|nr:hypothetical protein [Gammaproteobacteria bacterium]